ncbi:MAG: gliding motility-associated C-terminal domain-containing protein [Candidatus Latescibacteria bacterium]|nr:gliding motility-associated C-terminal domain-containing protein [Candidatus Latescibacterota bacterium]
MENFLAWYELRSGGNELAFSQGPCDVAGFGQGLDWPEPSDSRLKVLKSTTENLSVVVDLRFPTQSIRYLNLRPFPLRTWEIAELEVYGEGYVEETVFTSQILDFGQAVNWGKLRWSGQAPLGTRIEIRTRTGHTPDPNLYFTRNTNGNLTQISLKDYNKIDVGARLAPVYDLANWSFWSPPYDFAAGLRDPSRPAVAWEDGTAPLSPSPSRYLQLSVKLFSTFGAAPRLEQLSLQLAEVPLAREVVGEIWPVEVETFAPSTFTYVVRPVFQAGDAGFDRLEVRTPSRADSVRSVKVNGSEVDRRLFPPQVSDDRLVVGFPLLQDEEEDSFKLIEVVFDASVLRFGTEFSGWVFNSADPDQVRQPLRPGNSTHRFSGDVLAVKTPLGGALLVQVEVQSKVLTPNGDGVNDELVLSYKVREVALARPVVLRIWDLSGGLVRQLPPAQVKSGAFQYRWDGRDGAGRQVPPGTYLYELTLARGQEERQVGAFALAY